MRSFRSSLVALFAFSLAALVLPGRASAVAVLPYQAQGSVQFWSPNDFVGSGNATHLGRYTEAGNVSFAGTSDPDVLAVSGSIVYTAANGDELWADVTGTLNQATGAIVATLTYDGGTGRFVNSSGSSQLGGQLLGGGAAVAAVSGNIDY